MTLDGPMQSGTSLESILAYDKSLQGETPGNNGTQDNLTFSTIQFDHSNRPITNVSATVPASETIATCEVANVTLYKYTDSYATTISFGLDTSSCHAGQQNITNSTGELTSQIAIPGFGTGHLLFQRVSCGDDINRPGDALPDPLTSVQWSESTPYTYQYAFVVTTTTTAMTSDQLGEITDQELPPLSSQNVSAILCKVEHNIEPMKLMKTLSSNIHFVDKGTAGPAEKMTNLTDIEYAEVIWSTIYGSGTSGPVQQDQTYFPGQMADAMISLVEDTLGKSTTTPQLINPNELREAFVKVLEGVGTHLMNSIYMVPQPYDTAGVGTEMKDRLHVQYMQIWVMVGGFSLLSLLTLIIEFAVIRDVVCHDPSSLATHASVLAQSPSIQERLQGAGAF